MPCSENYGPAALTSEIDDPGTHSDLPSNAFIDLCFAIMSDDHVEKPKRLEAPVSEARLTRLRAAFRRASRRQREAESRTIFRMSVVGVFALTLAVTWYVLR